MGHARRCFVDNQLSSEERLLPFSDLDRVGVELLRQFRKHLPSLDGDQRHLSIVGHFLIAST